jgi:hypothetical protein
MPEFMKRVREAVGISKPEADGTQPEKIRFWKEQVKLALRFREDEERQWREFTSIFMADRRDITQSEIVSFNTHRGHKILTKMISLLTHRDPKWNVLSMNTTERAQDMASIVRGWLSWYMYSKNVLRDVHEPTIEDAVVCGTGITQVGFRTDPQEAKRSNNELALQAQMEFSAEAAAANLPEDIIAQVADEIDNQAKSMPPPEDAREQNFPGEPYYQNVDIWDFLIAPGYTSIESAYEGGGWVAKRIVIPLKRAKSDPRYKNRSSMKATIEIDTPHWGFLNGEGESGSLHNLPDLWEGWEIWIAPDPFKEKPTRVLVISESSPKAHFESDDPYPELNAFPFQAVKFKNRKGRFYGMPYLRHMQETLDNWDKMRSISLDIAKTKKPILTGQKGIHDEVEMERLAQSPAGHTLLINAPNALGSIDWPDVSPELMNELAMLAAETQELSGQGPNQLGTTSQPGVSATEASIVQQNVIADVQTFGKHRNTELVTAGRKLLKLLQTKGEPADILRASNTDGKTFVQFQRDEIIGEYDIRIGVGTTAPIDENIRRKQLLDMLVGLGGAFPANINVNRILVDIFELFDLPSPQDYVVNQEGREQYLEIAIMFKTGESTPVVQGDEHMRHIKELDFVLQPMVQSLQSGEIQDPEEMARTQLDIRNLMEHRQQHQLFLGIDPSTSGGVSLPQDNQITQGDLLAGVRGAI